MLKREKVVAIIGSTATGKSDLAVELALLFNGEVVSADSRQVYCGLNIGTGKITEKEMRGVPHHLLDVADLEITFSADNYKMLALPIVSEIHLRGRLPIICGGSGLYVRTLLSGIELPKVPPNDELREELSTWDTEDLIGELRVLDPVRTKEIDPKNRHRLIRAIEIAKAIGHISPLKESAPYDVLYIGLTLPSAELYERIHNRLITRLQNGMIEEVEKLVENGISHTHLQALGLECKYISLYLTKELSKDQMIVRLEMEINHYAKRQMTWFKKYAPTAKWHSQADREKIMLEVETFLKS